MSRGRKAPNAPGKAPRRPQKGITRGNKEWDGIRRQYAAERRGVGLEQLEQVVQGAEIREFRHGFSVCSVYIPLHHFQGGMAQNLLKGVDIPSVFQVTGGEGMAEEMGL